MTDIVEMTPPPAEFTPKARRRGRYLLAAGVVAMFALNVGVTQLLISQQRPVTVAFDMKGTIDRFMDQAAQRQLSEAQSAALSARFTQALDDSLSGYRQAHHALILVAPSVVGGATDITALIQHDVAVRMQTGWAVPQ